MMELVALFFLCALVAALIIPWVNLVRLKGQKDAIEGLKTELTLLKDKLRVESQGGGRAQAGGVSRSESEAETAPESQSEVPPPLPIRGRVSSVAPGSRGGASVPSRSEWSGGKGAQKSEAPVRARLSNGEALRGAGDVVESQDWFSKIAVWIGGVALLMAGFYMVKYSIDSGWLVPAVRVWLTAGFGVLLSGTGFVISLKAQRMANERIGQVLSGAGVACLYFASYAAVHLYGLLAPVQGFGCMVAVTVLAVLLSLRSGAAIAMMGLVGGFLTPWLMRTGSADTALLYTYLFLLFCGAQFLCQRRGWWGLLLGSMVAAYLWSGIVIVSNLQGSIESLKGTLLFVLGLCAVNAVWAMVGKANDCGGRARLLLSGVRIVAWSGGLMQSLVVVWIGEFAGVDLALFGVLSVGALWLAVLREATFNWAAWLALFAVALGGLSNPDPSFLSWFVWPAGLMALFFGVGHWKGLRSERPLVWRGLSTTAALLITPLLYLNREILMGQGAPFDGFWLVLAATVGLLLVLAGEHLLRRDPAGAMVAGEYQSFGVFLIGFGLWTYVPMAWLAHSVAVLLLVSAIYWKWRGSARSELVLGVLAAAWAGMMLPRVSEVLAYFFRMHSVAGQAPDGVAVMAWALGLLGGGVVLAWFRRDWSRSARSALDCAVGWSALCGLVALYQWLDQSWMSGAWARPVVEGGLTALFAVLALGCRVLLVCGSRGRFASGVLAVLAGIRVIVLHLADTGAAGESFFFNALFLQFGIPFLVAFALAWLCAADEAQRMRRVYQVSAMLLGFVWSTFLVQDYFGGTKLLGGRTSSTELYTYSVVWLLLAVLYQAIGLWRHQKAIHVGSLVLLLVTIGKVFLVDGSELEGLFRVLSFLGLGFALIGIGFFYNKVVFGRSETT